MAFLGQKHACPSCGCRLYQEVGDCAGAALLEALEEAARALDDAGKPFAASECRAAIAKASAT